MSRYLPVKKWYTVIITQGVHWYSASNLANVKVSTTHSTYVTGVHEPPKASKEPNTLKVKEGDTICAQHTMYVPLARSKSIRLWVLGTVGPGVEGVGAMRVCVCMCV